MNIARTAAHFGAHVATRTRVVGFLREGERVTGAASAISSTTARTRSAPAR